MSHHCIQGKEIRKIAGLFKNTNKKKLHSKKKYLQNILMFTNSCHTDEGGAKFLRNIGSYNSHMV
jgi:hypothetical protein